MFSSSDKHDSAALKKVAVAKLEKNKKIFRDPAFRGKLDQDFLIDLYEELIIWRIRNLDWKSETILNSLPTQV